MPPEKDRIDTYEEERLDNFYRFGRPKVQPDFDIELVDKEDEEKSDPDEFAGMHIENHRDTLVIGVE